MYSMVLMAAMMPAGDAAGFGKHKTGCTGCTGTPVVVTGCCGGCTGTHTGGFLGMHKHSCTGGGFLGMHKHGCTGTPVYGCTGYPVYGCTGTPVYGCTGYPVYGCTGGVVVPTSPPATMVKPSELKKDLPPPPPNPNKTTKD